MAGRGSRGPDRTMTNRRCPRGFVMSNDRAHLAAYSGKTSGTTSRTFRGMSIQLLVRYPATVAIGSKRPGTAAPISTRQNLTACTLADGAGRFAIGSSS